MARFTGKLLRIAIALVACSGCAADGTWSSARLMPWQRKRAADPSTVAADAALASDSTGGKGPAADNAAGKAPGNPAATASPTTGQAANPAAMSAVLAQLKEIGAIDQPTQDRLIEDLQKTDPALWPQMLDVFRASLAYRQKYGEQPSADPAVAAGGPSRARSLPPPDIAAEAAVVSDAGMRSPSQPSSVRSANVDANGHAGSVQATSAEAPVPQTDSPSANSTPANSSAAGQPRAAASVAESASKPEPEPTIAPVEPKCLDWREHLQAAIQGLESETADPPGTTAAIGRHAGLRLLYLVDGRRDAALKPIVGIPPTQQDFWSKELFALTTYLDADRNADESRRAAAASVPLREAAAKLGELATLSVRNLAFCTEVHSYGVFKKFPKYEFSAGQEVLLYAEVENFKTVASEKGFHTALKSSYEILDNHGARVDQKEFEITAEDCQNARRDYFIRYFVWMPKRIYGGNYTLQLTIEDTHSQKIGQSSIDFTIHEKDN